MPNTTQQRNPLMMIAMFAIVIVALFYIAKGIFNILAVIAPFLIIAAFFIDRETVIGYFKNIMTQLKSNTIIGLVLIGLTIFGFPLVSTFLFVKALLKQQINKKLADNPAFQNAKNNRKKDEYTEYEEVEEDDFLDLPELEYAKKETRSSKPAEDSSDYEQLFD